MPDLTEAVPSDAATGRRAEGHRTETGPAARVRRGEHSGKVGVSRRAPRAGSGGGDRCEPRINDFRKEGR